MKILVARFRNIFRLAGYRSIEVRKDMQGKNRMIRASHLEK